MQPINYLNLPDPTQEFHKWYGVGSVVGSTIAKGQADEITKRILGGGQAPAVQVADPSGIPTNPPAEGVPSATPAPAPQATFGGTQQDWADLSRVATPQQYAEVKARVDEENARQAAIAHQKLVSGLVTKVSSKDATAEDWANLATIIPADQAKQIQDGFMNMDKKKQSEALLQSGQVFSALSAGNTDLAKQLLQTQADARRNSGDDAGAKYLETLVQMTDAHPESAKLMLGYTIPMIPGGKEALQSILDQQEGARKEGDKGLVSRNLLDDALLKEKELAKIDLKEKRGGAELLPATETMMNNFVVKSLESKNIANQYDRLAADIDKSKPTSGTPGQVSEAWKKFWGSGDNITHLRQEFNRLRSSAVLKNLPPGSASDSDIKIALAAFPEDNSNPALVSQFLKGMGKLQRLDAAISDAQAEWINFNGNLGNAKEDMVIDGIKIKKGDKLSDFSNKYLMNTAAYMPNGTEKSDKSTEVDY